MCILQGQTRACQTVFASLGAFARLGHVAHALIKINLWRHLMKKTPSRLRATLKANRLSICLLQATMRYSKLFLALRGGTQFDEARSGKPWQLKASVSKHGDCTSSSMLLAMLVCSGLYTTNLEHSRNPPAQMKQVLHGQSLRMGSPG